MNGFVAYYSPVSLHTIVGWHKLGEGNLKDFPVNICWPCLNFLAVATGTMIFWKSVLTADFWSDFKSEVVNHLWDNLVLES